MKKYLPGFGYGFWSHEKFWSYEKESEEYAGWF